VNHNDDDGWYEVKETTKSKTGKVFFNVKLSAKRRIISVGRKETDKIDHQTLKVLESMNDCVGSFEGSSQSAIFTMKRKKQPRQRGFSLENA
jgi:hypothetical protein